MPGFVPTLRQGAPIIYQQEGLNGFYKGEHSIVVYYLFFHSIVVSILSSFLKKKTIFLTCIYYLFTAILFGYCM